jgi:hypothetical protein
MKLIHWMALCISTPLTGCITVSCPCVCHTADSIAATEGAAPPALLPPGTSASKSGPAEELQPPRAFELESIPLEAALREGRDDVFAVFEVEGDDLVAVAYEQREIAEGALALWRELVFRIPTNQRLDLVQFEITKEPDPAGATDNSGTGSRTGRFGYVLSFSAFNLGENPPHPAAPLSRRRGTFDWTLIHEFGHLRTYADGLVNDYIAEFGGRTVDLYEVNESFYLHQVSVAGRPFSESFRRVGDALLVENERLGDLALVPAPR